MVVINDMRVVFIMYKSYFFFNDTATTEIYTYGHTLARHDALPISQRTAHATEGLCGPLMITAPAARPVASAKPAPNSVPASIHRRCDFRPCNSSRDRKSTRLNSSH